ncbi:MAG: hypothetical protein HOM97_00425 [Nitrospina sp.]|nr:hypothetical protein [Nitrospina sp.]
MKRGLELTLILFAISFLASCASNTIVLPKRVQGAVKTYTVNPQGTVEILGQDMKLEPQHWLFVQCDHWSGCYMRCQGELNSCKKVATDSEFEVVNIYSPSGATK